MQIIYVYVDDSGVFHPNAPSNYFVYAGYVFLDKESKDSAMRGYRGRATQIKNSCGVSGELKACDLHPKHKRSLVQVLHHYPSFSVSVNLDRIYESILGDKKSIHRFKDYALKRAIKNVLNYLIRENQISPDIETDLRVFIDEQNVASNGIYSLKEGIYTELSQGILNFDYSTTHPRVFSAPLTVSVTYCDSKKHSLIQAADILANRIFTANVRNDNKLLRIKNHKHLFLP